MKKMNNAEKDSLIIKRDSLLKKKRLIDAIEKLRQGAPRDQKHFETDCFYLTNAVNVHQFDRLKDLLNFIEEEEAASFRIENSIGGNPWGYNTVKIEISEKFDEISKQIREEYHNLNKKLGRDKKEPSEIKNWAYYTNPFWVLWKFIILIWKHKIVSGVVAILGLLAIDYSLAWKNLQWLKNFLLSLFQ